jgi:glycosyltransferase involved in cell wall biosynthesis
MNALVSVGLPTYNRPERLRKALDCLTNQTYRNLEIIVSNDHSPNMDTYFILGEYSKKDLRLKVYTQSYNIGIYANFYFVLQKATGKYFMYAQEDDLWEPDFIHSLVSQLEKHPEQVMAMSAANRIDEDGKYFDTTRFNGLSDLHLAYFALYDERLSFLYMGLFQTNILKLFDCTPADIHGKDVTIMAEMILSHPFGYIDLPLYTKGLEHGKAKQFFDTDPFCFLKMYVDFVRRLLFSKYIPLKKKLYLPVIIPVNGVWMIRAYLAQVIFLLPKDHPLRKAMRSNALTK